MSKRTKKQSKKAMVDGVVVETSMRHAAATHETVKGMMQLLDVAARKANLGTEQAAGHLAEVLHVTSFNAEAARSGFDALRAATTASLGRPTAPADILVKSNEQVIGEAQVKFCGKVAATTKELADVKYDGMQRIAPADQVSRVKELAGKRGVDHLGANNYPDVANNASGQLKGGGVSGKPITRAQATDAAKNPAEAARNAVCDSIANAAKSGAMAGGAIGGGISAVSNTVAVFSGEKSAEDALVGTVVDTGVAAARGAAVASVASGVQAACTSAGLGAVARSSAPLAAGVMAVETAGSALQWLDGEIDGDEFAESVAKSALKTTATLGGAKAGAALGTAICPGVGTIVGGILGAIGLGSLFG